MNKCKHSYSGECSFIPFNNKIKCVLCGGLKDEK
jgi:hypothetical protein